MESSSEEENDWYKCKIEESISSVKLEGANKIIIEFENIGFGYYNRKITLHASSECCSVSWFEHNNIQSIIGKEIKYIYDSGQRVQLPKSNKQEYDRNGESHFHHEQRVVYDKNHLIVIKFTDDSEYQFYLRNSSNGYYDGNLNII